MNAVPHVVAVMGRGVVDADGPVVNADDLGLTRGDGCFDSARVVTDEAGRATVVDLAEHLDRLDRSARAMDIDNFSHARWQALVVDAVRTWTTPGEAVLKLVLTRGREWRAEGPTGLLTITHRGPSVPAGRAAPRSITAVTLTRGHPSDAFADAPWLLGGVKTLSYVVNVAAVREAKRRGAEDVVFTTTDGYALDGPTSGLLVARGGVLLSTPTGATGILESVTVSAIFEAARADGFEVRYELVPVADLYSADGLWLVSSGRGPAPVTALDGRPLQVDPDLATKIAGYAGF
jgi:4-amino-4-deoxychorismate lyase